MKRANRSKKRSNGGRAEKQRRTLMGSKKVVPYGQYCELVDEMRSPDGPDSVAESGGTQSSNVSRATVEFDEDTVSRLNLAEFLDNLSEDEEAYAIEDERKRHYDVNSAHLNARDRNRAEALNKQRRLPISKADRLRYTTKMDNMTWKPSSSDLAMIRRDFEANTRVNGKDRHPNDGLADTPTSGKYNLSEPNTQTETVSLHRVRNKVYF